MIRRLALLFVVLFLLPFAVAPACAGHQAAKRAAAVGIGAAGAGAAAAARTCVDDSDARCRSSLVTSTVVVLGMALSAWATAYLSETTPPAPPASAPSGEP